MGSHHSDLRRLDKESVNENSMKQSILKVIALTLLISTAFVIFTNRSKAQVSRDQNSSTTNTQAAPTEKTVEQVFKNIKVLNGMPQSQLYPAMRFMAASLGFQCGSCHVIRMVGEISLPTTSRRNKLPAR